MKYFNFSQTSSFTKLGVIVSTVFICGFLFLVLSSIFFDLDRLNNIKENIGLAKFFQGLYSLSFFLIPCLFLSSFLKYDLFLFSRVKKTVDYRLLFLLGVLCFVSLLPLVNLLIELNMMLSLPDFLSDLESLILASEEKTKEITLLFLEGENMNDLAINLVVIALIPALAEEFFFRGILQKYFIGLTKNVHWGIFVTSCVFSFIHFQFFGFLPRMFLGIVFGYFYLWSGTIFVPIFVHFFNNGMTVVYAYFLSKNGRADEVFSYEIVNNIPFYVVLLSIPLSAGLFYWFYQLRSKNEVNG